jgi:hypothetical protein
MDKSELLPHVFDVLRREPQTHLNAVEYQVRRSVEDYERPDALHVQEIVWDLLVQGVLAPGKNSLNLHLPFIHVTPYGRECLESGSILLHDPQGYLARLRDGVDGPLDETVAAYARESQHAFLTGSPSGAIALLGSAAQRCLDLLRDACGEPPADRAAVSTCLRSLNLSDAQRDDLEKRLEELFVLMGHSRDAQGRPIVPPGDRDTAQAHLLLFPSACHAVYRVLRLANQMSS